MGKNAGERAILREEKRLQKEKKRKSNFWCELNGKRR